MLPAKVIPDKNVAYVCHNGEEHPKDSFEVSKKWIFCFSILHNYLFFFKLFLFTKPQAIINIKHSIFLYVSNKKN